MRSRRTIVAAALAFALSSAVGGAALAVPHGNNPAQGGDSANPAGTGNGFDGGGGIHNIGSNPGQSGDHPRDRDTPPACDMHGGMADTGKNPNC